MKKIAVLAGAAALSMLLLSAASAEVYNATGTGIGGDVPVAVEITDGKIVSVTVGENNETQGIGSNAIEQLPAAIVEAQSLSVDTVSGATVTSSAILSAVEDALTQAGLNPEDYKTAAAAEDHTGETYPGEDEVNQIYADAEAKSQANAPKIKTLENGIQVQVTPDDVGGYWHRPGNYNSYNTYFLDADNRGCQACHESLQELLDNMSYKHLTFENNYGMDLTVMDCRICHDYGDGYLYTVSDLGTLIHGIHKGSAFTDAGGDCWSCHQATSDGKGMLLWDEAKYDVLQGITSVANVEGEFSYSQTVVSDASANDLLNWMSGDSTNSMAGAGYEDLPLDQGLFDTWTITVDGDVENPFTMTLPELIETFGLTTDYIKNQCVMNPAGGPWILNCKVTGISINQILEYACPKEGATAVMSYAPDGWNRGIYLTDLEKDGAILATQLNDESIGWTLGYPCSTWTGSNSAAACIRHVCELKVVSEDHIKTFDGWHFVDDDRNYGDYYNKPNAGIFQLHEGQILPVNEAHTFEGYADGYDEAIVAIEFSMDNGATWTRYETPDCKRSAWVYWNFTYTPDKESAYVFCVRAVTETGKVNSVVDKVMFNAK